MSESVKPAACVRLRALPRRIQFAGQRILDRASPRLRAVSRGAREVLWEFVRVLSVSTPGEPVDVPLAAIARELELCMRQVERLVAELVAAQLIRRHPDGALTWITSEALADLGFETKMSPLITKAEEVKSNVPPVDKPGLWIPPGTEALHEAVGDEAFRGLLGAAGRRGVKLQDVMARAGERVLSASRSVAGYVHALLRRGGDWTAPLRAPGGTTEPSAPGRGGEGITGGDYTRAEREHFAVAVFGAAARERLTAWKANRAIA